MAIKIPLSLDAEYRGQAKAGEFVNGSGEKVDYGEKLKFEVEDLDGDVSMLALGIRALDKAEGGVDCSKLKKGQCVRLTGFVSLGDRGTEQNSYLKVLHMELLGSPVAA